MHTTKIATCCYCGTRAALVLEAGRHELSCSACGAPLHEMKAIPVPSEAKTPARRPPAPISKPSQPFPDVEKHSTKAIKKHKDKKRKKSRYKRGLFGKTLTGKKVFGKIWDAIEDVFD